MSNFFLPYQVRWIKDPSRKRLMVKSRQIGISLSTAYDLVLKTGKRSCRFDTWVSSRDEFQAQRKKSEKKAGVKPGFCYVPCPLQKFAKGERPCSRLRVKAGGHNNT
jgi:hypothetical protein